MSNAIPLGSADAYRPLLKRMELIVSNGEEQLRAYMGQDAVGHIEGYSYFLKAIEELQYRLLQVGKALHERNLFWTRLSADAALNVPAYRAEQANAELTGTQYQLADQALKEFHARIAEWAGGVGVSELAYATILGVLKQARQSVAAARDMLTDVVSAGAQVSAGAALALVLVLLVFAK